MRWRFERAAGGGGFERQGWRFGDVCGFWAGDETAGEEGFGEGRGVGIVVRDRGGGGGGEGDGEDV